MVDLIGPKVLFYFFFYSECFFIKKIIFKVDISLCLNIFISLIESSKTNEDNWMLKLICMKQLSRLCTMNYDHIVYPYLSKELLKINLENLNAKNRLEMLYTKAFCIFQIISHR